MGALFIWAELIFLGCVEITLDYANEKTPGNLKVSVLHLHNRTLYGTFFFTLLPQNQL